MKKYYNFLMIVVITCFSSAIFAQGVTTSGINGKVIDEQGETLLGATVVLTEASTGSIYGTITDDKGNFHVPHVNAGGPYTLKISFVGYHAYEKEGLQLQLGQTQRFNVTLQPSTTTLATVEIVAKRNDIYDGNRTGAETFISNKTIKSVPSITGNLYDFARLTPQANMVGSGISIAGMNNRYNAVFIDGTAANDVFGLAANGMNGGQTGINAISNETIKQFQISVAPYDVRQSGFAGGSINAVTKNGTNTFTGEAYFKFRNQALSGKTPGDVDDADRTKLADFTAKTYGVSIGGPIIKDKLFFFINAEKQKDETPNPFRFENYTGDSNEAAIEAFGNFLRNEYGYEPGGYLNSVDLREAEKFLTRLDWNINKNHKLMVRYQYSKGVLTNAASSSRYGIGFGNAGEYRPSTTHSFAIELKSIFGNKFSNNLKIGYTSTLDDRGPVGANFPRIEIEDGSGTIKAGSEHYSSGNMLDQKIWTITDNFQIYAGDHTFTIGANIEFYDIYNMFMRRAWGYYSYDNLDMFMNKEPANYYRIGYSLVDDIRGDGSAAAADFNFFQIGAYLQDEWQVNDNLKLTAGIRVDVPIFKDNPEALPFYFNSSTLGTISSYYDLKGAKSGEMPSTQYLFSPRVGFNWDVYGDKTVQVRGGTGIFTSRTPFVWPAGSYTNNGLTIGDYTAYDTHVFNPDWQTQPIGNVPGSQVDLYAKNFKNPQMWKTNIAVDFKLPYDIQATAEVIYTKTINNVLWKDVNLKPAWGYLTGTPDNRPLFNKSDEIDSGYGQIMLGDNTNKGYTFTASLQLNKNFNKNFFASLSYTYGHAESIFDGTSSQNSSQWNYLQSSPVPNNEAEVGISSFDLGHRIVAFVSYQKEYLKHLKTGISLYYNGQSGQRISYLYNEYKGRMTNEAEWGTHLIFIPASADQINFGDRNGLASPAEQEAQWNELDAYIKGNDYLSGRRGQYAERNGSRLPFTHLFNVKFTQDLFVDVADRKQTIQLSLDIFNFANMLNKEWGNIYYSSNNNILLIDWETNIVDPNLSTTHELYGEKTLPLYSFERPENDEAYSISDSGIYSSRWNMMFTIRYIF